MNETSLGLATYLISESRPSVVVFVKITCPESVRSLPQIKAIVSMPSDSSCEPVPGAPTIINDWIHSQEWREQMLAAVGSSRQGAVALFLCSFEDIGQGTVDFLGKNGFSEIIYLNFGDWFSVSITSPWRRTVNKIRTTIYETMEMVKERYGRACHVIGNVQRKVLLRQFGTDLHTLYPEMYVAEGGHCFRAHLPQLRAHFDEVGIERDEYWLFEENTRLLPHRRHDAIRRIGMGQCALWESEVYFSSTDRSDPNSNGKRYRLVQMHGSRSWLKIPFSMFSRLDVSEENLDVGPQQPSLRARQSARDLLSGKPAPLKDSIGDIGRRLNVACPFKSESYWGNVEQINKPRGMMLRSDTRTKSADGKIVHYIGSLAPGGSERQLSYLVRGIKEAGKDITVLVPAPDPKLVEFSMHYKYVLDRAGVPIRLIAGPSEAFHPFVEGDAPENSAMAVQTPNEFIRQSVEDFWVLRSLPRYMGKDVYDIYTHLMDIKPSVFHSWLDHANVLGGIAALLAGVPQIVLSLRSVNPTHFPRLHMEWYREWYHRLSQCDRVRFVSNSAAGAASYAEWMDCPLSKIDVIPNGIEPDTFAAPSPTDVQNFRASLGIDGDVRLACGVFRFTSEKRPLRFLRVLAQIMSEMPDLHVVVAGEGPLLGQFEREVQNLQLKDRVHVLGRRRDVHVVMAASDLLLLTSTMEGFPNVLLEAQWLGLPVVAPRVGGIPEVVHDGVGGLLCERDSVDEMIAACRRILAEPSLRSKMSHAGQEFVRSRYTVDRMIASSLDLYTVANSDGVSRVVNVPAAPLAVSM